MIDTRDQIAVSDTRKRVWYARESIMGTLQTLGLPVSLNGGYIVARNVDPIARWLVAISDTDIAELFGAGLPKFKEAMSAFEAMAGPINVKHVSPIGLSYGSGRVIIAGAAMKVILPSSGGSAEVGPEIFVIPVSRKKMTTGAEWIETVALVPKSLLGRWNDITMAVAAADRIIDSSSKILRVYNGPDIKIQPIKLEDIVMEEGVKQNFVEDITAFLARKSWYEARNLSWTRKYALNGPPGTGKTSLMRWACTELGLPSVSFDFTDEYASGSTFTSAIRYASRRAPCIICFDDLDRVLAGDNRSRIGVHTIQTALSGMIDLNGVIVMATCNDHKLLLQGPMGRRFDSMGDVPLPIEEFRAIYLRKILSMDSVTESHIQRVAKGTDGWSYSDLMSAMTAAANKVMARRGDTIRDDDLTAGIEVVRMRKRASPSVTMREDPQEVD